MRDKFSTDPFVLQLYNEDTLKMRCGYVHCAGPAQIESLDGSGFLVMRERAAPPNY